MNLKRILVLFYAIVGFTLTAFSQHQTDNTEAHETGGEKKFQPGPFITEHIADSYEWHIATFGKFHLSIPLPVILYSKTSGFHVFMSSKFHHGHEAHKGFIITHKTENKGKVVEIMPDGSEVRPYDISITKNVLSLLMSLGFMLWIFISIANRYKRNPESAPKGMQSFLEPLILFIRDDVAKSSIGEKKYQKFLPYLLTVFFFIFFNNLFGLIPIFPGGANLTGNIAITLVLAVFTFVLTTINANTNYWVHIFWPSGVPVWLKIPPIIPLVEIIGVFTKPFVLMVRLFANITAGHVIALGFFGLIFIFGNMNMVAGYGISVISIAFTVFMTLLELLVAFIQAYVFTLLSAIYFGMAVEEHHH